MNRFKEFEDKKYEIFEKHKDDSVAAKEALDALAEEYSDLISSADLPDNPGFIRDQVGQLASLEEVPTEPIIYNEEKIKEQHQKIFDQVYRIEVEVMEDGQLPCKAHKTDAGFDLFATEDMEFSFGQGIKHPLNIKMKLPEGSYAQITSKSGLGSKGLLVYAGIIDESYRGIPHVVGAHIRSDLPPIKIKKGTKIAQLIMHPYSPSYYMAEVDEVSEDTDRGDGGFGSSGA